MTWTRRELLKLAGKLGLLSALPPLAGCPTEEEPDPENPWPPFEGCAPETVDWSYEGEPGPETLFSHGVASGDPLADSVILWTRVSPAEEGPVEVYWEVSESADFGAVLASGVVTTSADRDYTVKVDAGCLRPATSYHYRFQALGRTSPAGRTRTASYGEIAHMRFAFCSCSNYAYGYFHAYRALAERDDVEVIHHLGDYIYEYGDGQYGDLRELDPPHEIVSLSDYRRRYALYRTDEDLQAVHARHPFVCTWDDHETANNAWSGGAENHDGGEGDWTVRREAGRRAFFEWLPVREGAEGRIYRQFLTNSLVDFLVLDTRIHGRAEQDGDPDVVYDPARQLLGADQEAWLLERLSGSPSRWKVLAQQIVVADWSAAQDAEGRARPLNTDAWGGYWHARQRILELVADEGLDGFVVLTGDVHSSWANDLTTDFLSYNATTHPSAVGVEAVTPGITSPGVGGIEGALSVLEHVRWGDGGRRGFVVVDVTPERMHFDWHLLPDGSIDTPTYVEPELAASWVCNHGQPFWVEAEGGLD